MKLFYYDTKHQQVHAEVDMGELSEKEVSLVNKVLEFLQDNEITDGRYVNIALAEAIDVMYVDGDPQLIIRDAK